MKKIGYLLSTNIDNIGIKRLQKKINYFKKTSNDEDFYLIDLSHFNLFKVKNYEAYFKNYNIKYLKLKSFKEIKEIFKKYQFFLFIGDVGSISEILIFFILKIYGIKLIMLNTRGFVLTSSKKITDIFSVTSKYYFKKINILAFRVLSILNIIPKVEYYFETSQEKFNFLNNSLSKKIDKLLGFNFLSLYKKIYRINSNLVDNFDILKLEKENNNEILNYIVVADSGYFHPDKLIYDILPKEKILENSKSYYKNLCEFLLSLEKNYKSKVSFCKHPRSSYPKDEFNIIENSFKVFSENTEDEILKSQMVIFTGGSSLVNFAILSNKKILFIKTDDQYYFSSQIDSIRQIIPLGNINLDKFSNLYKNSTLDKNFHYDLYEKCKFKTTEYNKFIYNNLVYNKNEKSYKQVKNIIFKTNV